MSGTLRRLAWRSAVAVAAVIALVVIAAMAAYGSGWLKNFHLPAEAMAPTLEKGDRFVALMDGGATLKRGDVIVFAVGEGTYVKRVAALAGDSIGLRDGIVILNGRPVAQSFVKAERRSEISGAPPARRLAERFPGERTAHEILDLGPFEFDDFPEQRVPAGHVFVLGDNRDRSADSRVPRTMMGVELLPLADIKGHALFHTWPSARAWSKVNP